jgi:amidophosphoribosyltransferase
MMDRLNQKDCCRLICTTNKYPDCYGIDMAKLEGLVAFRAALELLKERNLYYIVEEVYLKWPGKL